MGWSKIILIIFFITGYSSIGFAQKKKVEKPVYLQYVVDNNDLTKIDNKYERFKAQSIGHFSNSDYIPTTTDELPLDFIIIPILRDRVGEYWIYMEYFPSSFPERPLEQRIYQFVKQDRDTTLLYMYHLKEPSSYVNEWKKEEPFKELSILDDLERTPSCDAYAVVLESQNYQHEVTSRPEGCDLLSPSGDATKAANQYEISDMGYVMCIDFLNDKSELVKPCPDGGVFFKRMDYKALNYKALGPIIEIGKKKKPKKEKKKKKKRNRKRDKNPEI